jgi:hypothetical protein
MKVNEYLPNLDVEVPVWFDALERFYRPWKMAYFLIPVEYRGCNQALDAVTYQTSCPGYIQTYEQLSMLVDNLRFLGQYLCAALGDRSHRQSLTSQSILKHANSRIKRKKYSYLRRPTRRNLQNVLQVSDLTQGSLRDNLPISQFLRWGSHLVSVWTTVGSKSKTVLCCALLARQVRATFASDSCDVLIMQISFCDVIKWGRLCSTEFSNCIDKTDHNFVTAGNLFMKYSVLLLQSHYKHSPTCRKILTRTLNLKSVKNWPEIVSKHPLLWIINMPWLVASIIEWLTAPIQ